MLLLGGDRLKLALNLFHKGFVVLLDRHLCQSDGILQARAKPLVACNLVLRLLDHLQHLARFFGVVPKIGSLRLRLEILQILLRFFNAKRRAKLLDRFAQCDQFIFCVFQCNDQRVPPTP